jgi:uncharacterized protein DUF4197
MAFYLKEDVMKKIILLAVFLCFVVTPATRAGFFDNLLKGITKGESKSGLSDSTIISGLKEALSVSTKKAVTSVSQVDGYYENPLIKVLLPEKIQSAAKLLRKAGFGKTVDEFELSMNRAVESAAPEAADIFIGAIGEMSFDDARGILAGDDTAATAYFKDKTSGRLFDIFKPIVSKSMDNVNATKYYKDMVSKYTAVIPFSSMESLDLDEYVTNKGLDGLFLMMAEQEKKIRQNPVERTTDLLKTVFGQS